MSATVHVSNISSQTTEKEVRDFFSFCGKIASLKLTPSSKDPNAPQSATVTFERPSAASTALLLDQTLLGGSNVHVETAPSIDQLAGSQAATSADESPNGGDIRQEDKPRAAILAEYLSAGYIIGDNALQKGIELDKKHGVSAKFTSYLTSTLHTIETKFNATEKAKSIEATYHVTDKIKETQNTLQHYFERALGTATGQKIREFYLSSEKQVLDIHNEAKRLAELKKQQQQQASQTTCQCAGNEGVCSCEPGRCACPGCNKAGDKKVSGQAQAATHEKSL